MSESEQKGGLIFYGKGRCSSCHNGPYFTDFQFHAIATPQLGFGKNGFGIDYGRYNSTLRDEDRYRFRTPPLWNVTKTAPYFHSGSVQELEDAILLHVDPLGSGVKPQRFPAAQAPASRVMHSDGGQSLGSGATPLQPPSPSQVSLSVHSSPSSQLVWLAATGV